MMEHSPEESRKVLFDMLTASWSQTRPDALAALDTLTDELQRLRGERDDALMMYRATAKAELNLQAENTELRAALERVQQISRTAAMDRMELIKRTVDAALASHTGDTRAEASRNP